MLACMRWRSRPRRPANEDQRDGEGAGPIALLAPRPARIIPVASQLAARGSCGTIDDRSQHTILIEGGPFVVARKEWLKSSIRVIGQLSIGFIKRRWCRNFAAAPHGFRGMNVANVAVDRRFVPKKDRGLCKIAQIGNASGR